MDVQQWELATMFPGVAPRQMRIRIIFQVDTGEIALSLVRKVASKSTNKLLTNLLLDCTTTDGKQCVFPFRYNGVIYKGCTKVTWEGKYTNNPWCSTEVNEDGNYVGLWGNCSQSCQNGNRNFKNFLSTAKQIVNLQQARAASELSLN